MYFDSTCVGGADAFDAWADYVGHSYDIARNLDAEGPTGARAKAWGIDNLIVSTAEYGPQVSTLRIGRGRQTDPDAIHVRIYNKGRGRGLANGEPFQIKQGEVHVFDMSRALTSETEGMSFSSVFVPHAAIGFDPTLHKAHGTLHTDSPSGRMLAAAIGALAETHHTTPLEEKRDLATGFLGLVRALVLGQMEGGASVRAVEAARDADIRTFIEKELANRDIGIDMICQACGTSRSAVYRHFEDEGGVRRYVMRRRLERAREDLATGAASRGRVAHVAARWGFSDQGHFTRAFRSTFGEAPSSVMGRDAKSND